MEEYSAYGTWKVTTEGDCEGRSIRDLGTYTGFFDEIAFALADKQYYSLRLEPVESKPLAMVPVKTEVNVSLGIASGTWEMQNDKRKKYFNKMLAGQDCYVCDCNYYASVTLKKEVPEEEIIKNKLKAKLADAGFDLEQVEEVFSK